MFTRTSKYNEALESNERLEFEKKNVILQLNKLVDDYNRLVRWINKYGGTDTIDTRMKGETRFTDDEINTLIRLCHPDKHNGSPSANRITTKLLSMRNK